MNALKPTLTAFQHPSCHLTNSRAPWQRNWIRRARPMRPQRRSILRGEGRLCVRSSRGGGCALRPVSPLTGAPEPHLVFCATYRSAAWAKLGKWAEAEAIGRRAARDRLLAAELRREGALTTGVCAAGLRAAGRGAQLGFGSGLSSARIARSLPQLQLRTLVYLLRTLLLPSCSSAATLTLTRRARSARPRSSTRPAASSCSACCAAACRRPRTPPPSQPRPRER